MKRIMSLLLAAVLLCSAFTAAVVPMASAEDASTVVEETGKTREICLVYDDSGSMDYSSRWLYAKYALKIFGALLTENDTLSVYPMNQINNGGDPLTLKGSASTAEIVSAIDDNVYTYPGGEGPTPYATVQRAYADLQSSSADIKWLVVLTDGQFTDVTSASGVAELFTNKPDDISVLFYGLALNDAPKAAMDGYKTAIEKILSGEQGVGSALTSDEDVIVTYTLQNAAEKIVEDMQEIAKKVFNRNSIEAKKLRTEGTKVPMSEVVVFAQGAEVPITGIRAVDGSAEYKVTDSVTVESNDYAYKDIENDPCIKNTEDIYPPHDGKPEDDKVCTWDNPDKIKMYGTLASVTGSYTSNTKYEVVYEGDISEDNIVIFFKPNVKLRARLIDEADGTEYVLDEVDGQELDAGDYKVIFEIIAVDTGEVIDDRNIIEGLSFEGEIDGKNLKDLQKPDDSGAGEYLITLEPGNVTFDITAIYNGGQYKTPYKVTVKVNNRKAITYELVEAPKYIVDTNGLHEVDSNDTLQEVTTPVKIKVLVEGRELADAEWQTIGEPEIKVKGQSGKGFGNGEGDAKGASIQKSTEEKGIYYLYISEYTEVPKKTLHGTIKVDLHYKAEHDEVTWRGDSKVEFEILSNLSFWEEYGETITCWFGWLALIIGIFAQGFFIKVKPKYNATVTARNNGGIWHIGQPTCSWRGDKLTASVGSASGSFEMKGFPSLYKWWFTKSASMKIKDFSLATIEGKFGSTAIELKDGQWVKKSGNRPFTLPEDILGFSFTNDFSSNYGSKFAKFRLSAVEGSVFKRTAGIKGGFWIVTDLLFVAALFAIWTIMKISC